MRQVLLTTAISISLLVPVQVVHADSARATTARNAFGTASGAVTRSLPPASIKRLQPVNPAVSTKLVIDHANRQAIRNVTKIPPSWKLSPPKSGAQAGMTKLPKDSRREVGVQFVHPKHSNRHVRVMPGNVSDPDLYKRQAYVRAHGDGGYRDVNGNLLNRTEFANAGNLAEFNRRTHIPLANFDYNRMNLN